MLLYIHGQGKSPNKNLEAIKMKTTTLMQDILNNMKWNFFDMVDEHEKLEAKKAELNELYNKYCFEDMLVCGLILDEVHRTQIKIKELENDLTEARENNFTKQELRIIRAEYYARKAKVGA